MGCEKTLQRHNNIRELEKISKGKQTEFINNFNAFKIKKEVQPSIMLESLTVISLN